MTTCNFMLNTDISNITYCSSGVYAVSLSLFKAIFQFYSPTFSTNVSLSSIINDLSSNIIYYLASSSFPNINPVHAMMNTSLSEGRINNVYNKQLIKHDYLFYISQKLHKHASCAFLYNNTKILNNNIEEIGWEFKTRIEQLITYADNNGNGLSNNITDDTNVTRRLLQQLIHFDQYRLTPNSEQLYSMPFIDGDTISIFFNIKHSNSIIEERKYRLILYLTDDINLLNNNIHPLDSVVHNSNYNGIITNDGVP